MRNPFYISSQLPTLSSPLSGLNSITKSRPSSQSKSHHRLKSSRIVMVSDCNRNSNTLAIMLVQGFVQGEFRKSKLVGMNIF